MANDALSVIAEYLDSGKERVRRNAAIALAALGSTPSIERLVGLALEDREAAVRDQAREEILQLQGESAEVATKVMKAGLEDKKTQRGAYALLGRLRSAGAAIEPRGRSFTQRLAAAAAPASLLSPDARWRPNWRLLLSGLLGGLLGAVLVALFLFLLVKGLSPEPSMTLGLLTLGVVLSTVAAFVCGQRSSPLPFHFDRLSGFLLECGWAAVGGAVLGLILGLFLGLFELVHGGLAMVAWSAMALGLAAAAVRVGTVLALFPFRGGFLRLVMPWITGAALGIAVISILGALVISATPKPLTPGSRVVLRDPGDGSWYAELDKYANRLLTVEYVDTDDTFAVREDPDGNLFRANWIVSIEPPPLFPPRPVPIEGDFPGDFPLLFEETELGRIYLGSTVTLRGLDEAGLGGFEDRPLTVVYIGTDYTFQVREDPDGNWFSFDSVVSSVPPDELPKFDFVESPLDFKDTDQGRIYLGSTVIVENLGGDPDWDDEYANRPLTVAYIDAQDTFKVQEDLGLNWWPFDGVTSNEPPAELPIESEIEPPDEAPAELDAEAFGEAPSEPGMWAETGPGAGVIWLLALPMIFGLSYSYTALDRRAEYSGSIAGRLGGWISPTLVTLFAGVTILVAVGPSEFEAEPTEKEEAKWLVGVGKDENVEGFELLEFSRNDPPEVHLRVGFPQTIDAWLPDASQAGTDYVLSLFEVGGNSIAEADDPPSIEGVELEKAREYELRVKTYGEADGYGEAVAVEAQDVLATLSNRLGHDQQRRNSDWLGVILNERPDGETSTRKIVLHTLRGRVEIGSKVEVELPDRAGEVGMEDEARGPMTIKSLVQEGDDVFFRAEDEENEHTWNVSWITKVVQGSKPEPGRERAGSGHEPGLEKRKASELGVDPPTESEDG